jgi:mRNA interferase MazF
VLVVSADSFNRSRISTVVCVAVTSNISLASAPGNVLLDEDATPLGRTSVINVSQTATISKAELTTRISRLDDATMHLVEIGLRRVLAL